LPCSLLTDIVIKKSCSQNDTLVRGLQIRFFEQLTNLPEGVTPSETSFEKMLQLRRCCNAANDCTFRVASASSQNVCAPAVLRFPLITTESQKQGLFAPLPRSTQTRGSLAGAYFFESTVCIFCGLQEKNPDLVNH
jgi:hypothetical protein